ncbi:subtilisin-like serine protease [Tulasnella sp. 418]|nr:subtilisin-like serine protease [Tulasnella sp. 418]
MSYKAPFHTCDGPKEEGSYIVKLKSHSVKSNFMAKCSAEHTDQLDITHSFEESDLFHGFVVRCSGEVLDVLRDREDVEYICEDAIMKGTRVQEDATWNLHRISHEGQANPPFEYAYPDSGGEGVNVYVLDTGIFIGHSEFEGRARNGRTFFPGFNDVYQHGTHIAGAIIGKTYGVAKKAEAISVRVLGDNGNGSISNIIGGLDWVVSQHRSIGKPSVINLGLNGSPSVALDHAVNNIDKMGMPVIVGAGNEGVDAINTSPARAAGAYVVGVLNQRDTRADFSNFGEIVKIWVPGVDITSAGFSGPDSTYTMSGSSLATAHASGIFALYMSQSGPGATPAQIQELIRHNAVTNGEGLLVAQVPKTN